MRRVAYALALLVFVVGPAVADTRLDELRAHFTLSQKPVPPEVLGDLGASDLADPGHSVRVSVDLLAAMHSVLYSDRVEAGKGWVSQARRASGSDKVDDAMGYMFAGATRSGLLVVISSSWGGGSGHYFTLQILDASVAHAFDQDGKRYERLNLTAIRNIPLGDRWRGTVSISGDTLTVVTEAGPPNNSDLAPTTRTIVAERPD